MLQFKEFMGLSMDQKKERYEELTEEDKFRLRMESGMPRTPRCNDCRARNKEQPLVCEAYPDGLTAERIRAAEKECDYFKD